MAAMCLTAAGVCGTMALGRPRRLTAEPNAGEGARTMAILQDVSQMQAELAKLRAENAKLKAANASVSLRVTEKGGVSMYGLGRFPVTLYRGQWERLIEAVPALKAFIEANASSLSVKE